MTGMSMPADVKGTDFLLLVALLGLTCWATTTSVCSAFVAAAVMYPAILETGPNKLASFLPVHSCPL